MLFLSSCVALLAFSQRVAARPSSYAVWAADSAIARNQGHGATLTYDDGEFQWALRLLYERTGNKTYYNWVQSGADNIVSSSGTIKGYSLTAYTLDNLRVGPTQLYLYAQTKQDKYKKAADTLHSQFNSHPRIANGQFWHKQVYYNQGWGDGLYMGGPFYAQYTKAFQPSNTTAWADITKQFQQQYANSLQSNTGLLYHGYDYSHTASWASSDRGHSIEVWDRALGWYLMALVDTIPDLPSANAQPLLTQLKALVPAVVQAADKTSGVWWLVMSQPGRAGNYFESSGSSMFIYSCLKAVRLGYVQDNGGTIVAAMKKAYSYMTKNWVVEKSDGTFDWLNTVQVGSLSGDGTFEYYVSVAMRTNDLKGLAAFLLASLEYEAL